MNPTILVVDDSPAVIKFLSYSFKSKGYRVLAACDGMDALEKLSGLERGVDLIITDLDMPNLDGYRFIETIRQNEAYRNTPVIILTSELGDEDRRRGMAAGVSSYLVKPFKSSLLLSEAAKYLERSISPVN